MDRAPRTVRPRPHRKRGAIRSAKVCVNAAGSGTNCATTRSRTPASAIPCGGSTQCSIRSVTVDCAARNDVRPGSSTSAALRAAVSGEAWCRES
ncbi:hypothetical protein [Yinghuangia sp. YIM S09857]|uniref:hypothetical protein n=1 Tax=Yinghuangia sp. YIM S09857 TaxID=3436929 RepID=UPI003F52E7E6